MICWLDAYRLISVVHARLKDCSSWQSFGHLPARLAADRPFIFDREGNDRELPVYYLWRNVERRGACEQQMTKVTIS